jgi:hypothetical protein
MAHVLEFQRGLRLARVFVDAWIEQAIASSASAEDVPLMTR